MHWRNNNFRYCFFYRSANTTCRNLFIVAMLLSCPTGVIAEEPPNLAKPRIVVPESIAGVNTVTAEQVIEALSSDTPPLLIDARIKDDREYGYIESIIHCLREVGVDNAQGYAVARPLPLASVDFNDSKQVLTSVTLDRPAGEQS